MKKLIVLTISASVILLYGCLAKNDQFLSEGPCLIETLLISDTILPVGTFYETGSRSAYDPPAKIGIEKIGTSFSSERAGGIIHSVYRFNTEKETQDKMELAVIYEFENENNFHWFAPPITPKINADEFKLACTLLSQNGVRCRMVAKYEVYFSDLYIDLIAINYDDMKSIIEYLDNRMITCLRP